MGLRGKHRECSPGLIVAVQPLWGLPGAAQGPCRALRAFFSDWQGEAAGRSTGPSQCVRQCLHPWHLWVMPWGAQGSALSCHSPHSPLQMPHRSVLSLGQLRAACDRVPAQTVLHSPEHPHPHGNGLPRAVRLMKTEIATQ